MSPSPEDRVARWLLIAGAALGIALATLAILRSGRRAAPDLEGAIAVVDGRAISAEAFARFAGAVAAERKQLTLDPAERRRLLERMIDEELLLQRGIDLGLPRHEPMARRSIVSALIASVTAEAELAEPSEDELRAFHAANPALFTSPERVVLDVALVAVADRPDAAAFRDAGELARRLRAGEPFAELSRELGDPLLAELPQGRVRMDTVQRYLGPTAARAATELAVGEVSDPVRGAAGYYVLRLRERLPGTPAPFEEVRPQVRREVLRERGDRALRDYLAELRRGSDVRILDPELDGS